MALPRPPVLPTFSTDATYPAGASPWSGQPPRVAPSGTVLARGFTPQADLAAEFLNYLHGISLDFVKYLDSWWNPPSVSSNLPQLRFLDAAGNGRHVIDHNGLPTGGRITPMVEVWGVTPGGAGSPWSTNFGTAAAVASQNPTTSYNSRFQQLTPSSTSGIANYALIYSAPLVICNTSGMTLVAEFEFGLNAAGAGITSNTSWFLGFDTGTDPINADTQLIGLYKSYNQANWQTLAANGGIHNSTVTSPATPPTAGVFPTDRFRVEIQGSGSPYGAYQAKFWINEVLVGTVAAGLLPGAQAMRFMFGCCNEGGAPSGSPLGFMSPITIMWNRFTSGPNL